MLKTAIKLSFSVLIVCATLVFVFLGTKLLVNHVETKLLNPSSTCQPATITETEKIAELKAEIETMKLQVMEPIVVDGTVKPNPNLPLSTNLVALLITSVVMLALVIMVLTIFNGSYSKDFFAMIEKLYDKGK